MLAVKVVVHGLVDFIQNFSKKSHETPQVAAASECVPTRSSGVTQYEIIGNNAACNSAAVCHYIVLLPAATKQQVQDEHVPGPAHAGWLSPGDQLHLRALPGRAGEVSGCGDALKRRQLAHSLAAQALTRASPLSPPTCQVQDEEQEDRQHWQKLSICPDASRQSRGQCDKYPCRGGFSRWLRERGERNVTDGGHSPSPAHPSGWRDSG